MITRVKIDGYKSFKDFELEMKPLMVIFGPNASGKSNFLDALQLIGMIATEKDIKAAFDNHRGTLWQSLYNSRTRRSMVRKKEDLFSMSFEVDVELGDLVYSKVKEKIEDHKKYLKKTKKVAEVGEKNWRFFTKLEGQTTSMKTQIIEERLTALSKEQPRKEIESPNIRDKDKLYYMENNSKHLLADEIGLNYSFLSRFFEEQNSRNLINKALREEMSRWKFYYLDPQTLMRADSPIGLIEGIGSKGENLAGFLHSLKSTDPKNFDNLVRTMRLLIPEIKDVDILKNLEDNFIRLTIKEHGSKINTSTRLLSEGTLRVLGVLSIFHSIYKPTVVGYEEPENGVHPARLKLIADMFKNLSKYQNTQVIINTHSPDFVSFFEDKDLFVCKKVKGRTKIEPVAQIEPRFRKRIIKKSLYDIED